jgi:alkylated DNA repair dioxygenase AlkB
MQLFDDLRMLPEGFVYRPEFLGIDEERDLLARIRAQEFHEVRMHGVVARRRVIQYGWKYAFDGARLAPGPSIPEFLLPVRDRAAALGGAAPEDLSEALLTEYQPRAPIGWHRDARGFGIVIGISLLSACRFRFRKRPTSASEASRRRREKDRTEIVLEPRSAYVLAGPARTTWEHSIPAVGMLRYSITFRTVTGNR